MKGNFNFTEVKCNFGQSGVYIIVFKELKII